MAARLGRHRMYTSIAPLPSPLQCSLMGKGCPKVQAQQIHVFLPSTHCSTRGKEQPLQQTGEGGSCQPHQADATQTPSPGARPIAARRLCLPSCACAPKIPHPSPLQHFGEGAAARVASLLPSALRFEDAAEIAAWETLQRPPFPHCGPGGGGGCPPLCHACADPHICSGSHLWRAAQWS